MTCRRTWFRSFAVAASLVGSALSPSRATAQAAPAFSIPLGQFFLGQVLISRFHNCDDVVYPGLCVDARVEQGIRLSDRRAAARGILWVTRDEPFQHFDETWHDFLIANTAATGLNAAGAFFFGPFGDFGSDERDGGRDAVLTPVETIEFEGAYHARDFEGTEALIDTFAGPLHDPWRTVSPEPATLALVGGGLLALGGVVRRRRSA